MLIKAADDHGPAIAALTALLARPGLSATKAGLIEQEIRNIASGDKGERSAAYDMEFLTGASKNSMTIHDLRLEFGGQVAQIDHLIITRLLVVWVCESKHFAEGVAINEQGEWSAFYRGQRRGIPSPIEQNRRHVALLQEVLASGAIELPKRLGIRLVPEVRSLVLVSKNAQVVRPRNWRQVPGLHTVIKSDQLVTTIDRAADATVERAASGKDMLDILPLLKAVGTETIERIARSLVAMDKPIETDWAARFGLVDTPSAGAETGSAGPTKAAVVCAACGVAVSAATVAYSEANRSRFDGRVLCYKCQRSTARPRTHDRGPSQQ